MKMTVSWSLWTSTHRLTSPELTQHKCCANTEQSEVRFCLWFSSDVDPCFCVNGSNQGLNQDNSPVHPFTICARTSNLPHLSLVLSNVTLGDLILLFRQAAHRLHWGEKPESIKTQEMRIKRELHQFFRETACLSLSNIETYSFCLFYISVKVLSHVLYL